MGGEECEEWLRAAKNPLGDSPCEATDVAQRGVAGHHLCNDGAVCLALVGAQQQSGSGGRPGQTGSRVRGDGGDEVLG